MSNWDLVERRRIQEELDKLLSPELVSMRDEAAGLESLSRSYYYLSIQQARALANEIFGPDNWKIEVKWDILEHVGEVNSHGYEFEAAAACCTRVTLRNGTFHEDIGSSHTKAFSKEEAIQKAKLIAKSDATKRALRQFGNALGNCLYDHEFASHLATLTTSDSAISQDAA